jgi:hypothetical protein
MRTSKSAKGFLSKPFLITGKIYILFKSLIFKKLLRSPNTGREPCGRRGVVIK